MTQIQITKAEALRKLQNATAITMVHYESMHYGLGVMVPSTSTRVVGKRRQVTGKRARGVLINDSVLDIDENHQVHLNEDGNLVVEGIDHNGDIWVRMTYLIEN